MQERLCKSLGGTTGLLLTMNLAQLSMVSKENLPKEILPGPETFSGCTANTQTWK